MASIWLSSRVLNGREEVVVTLDGPAKSSRGDPRLLEKIQEGYDVVCGQRISRQDPLLRKLLSSLASKLASRLVGVTMGDYGSMLRAYRRPVVDQVLRCQDRSMYIPALANSFCRLDSGDSGRAPTAGCGRLQVQPHRAAAFDGRLGHRSVALADPAYQSSGSSLALLGVGFGLYIALQSLQGLPKTMLSALMALILFMAGLQLLALGLIGEYVEACGSAAPTVRHPGALGVNERRCALVFGYHTIGFPLLKELLDRGEEVAPSSRTRMIPMSTSGSSRWSSSRRRQACLSSLQTHQIRRQ